MRQEEIGRTLLFKMLVSGKLYCFRANFIVPKQNQQTCPQAQPLDQHH